MEQNNFSNFGRGSPKDDLCEIILKSGNLPKRRCPLCSGELKIGPRCSPGDKRGNLHPHLSSSSHALWPFLFILMFDICLSH